MSLNMASSHMCKMKQENRRVQSIIYIQQQHDICMQSSMDEVGLNEYIVIRLISYPARIYNVKVVSAEGSNSLSLLVSYRPPLLYSSTAYRFALVFRLLLLKSGTCQTATRSLLHTLLAAKCLFRALMFSRSMLQKGHDSLHFSQVPSSCRS